VRPVSRGSRFADKNRTKEVVYDRYMRYLTGCAELFRDGYTDVCQFTLAKG